MGDRTCTCINAEDENLMPGTRCCACRAFYKLALPLGREQRCPCGHVRGPPMMELLDMMDGGGEPCGVWVRGHVDPGALAAAASERESLSMDDSYSAFEVHQLYLVERPAPKGGALDVLFKVAQPEQDGAYAATVLLYDGQDPRRFLGSIEEEKKDPLWQRFTWWWTWRVWRPLRCRCSWCNERLTMLDIADGAHLGWAARACAGCVEYPGG